MASSNKKSRLNVKTAISSDDEDFSSKSLASIKTEMDDDDDGRLFPEEMVTVKVEESNDGPSYVSVQVLMEELIEAVREFPCLWNTKHLKYRDQMKKDMAWQAVVNYLNSSLITNIKTAKAEWKKLRDNHRDSLKRVKVGYGQEPINPWKFAESMAFLLPCMKTRDKNKLKHRSQSLDNDETSFKSRLESSDQSMSEAFTRLEQLRQSRLVSNKEQPPIVEDHDSESRSSDGDNATRKRKADSNEIEIELACEDRTKRSEYIHLENEPVREDRTKISEYRHLENEPVREDRTKISEYRHLENEPVREDRTKISEYRHLENEPVREDRTKISEYRHLENEQMREDRTKISEHRHPLDAFFESMCQTTKQFPAWMQKKVKRQIFSVVSEAEDYLDNSSENCNGLTSTSKTTTIN